MQIIVKGKNIHLNDDLRDYATEKFLKYEPQLEEPTVCEVVLSDELGTKGGIDKSVHVTATLPGVKNPLHVEAQTSDFFGSIDLVQEKFEREILKYKEKVKIGPRHTKKVE